MVMKLFDDFEAIKFPEENLIFITRGEYLYYIYNNEYKHWHKHKNAGNDHITVKNYPDVSREELINIMQGTFPTKETDFMRMCNPAELCAMNMVDLLKEDYPSYMSNCDIYYSVRQFISESDICHKTFLELQKMFDNAVLIKQEDKYVLNEIMELCFKIIGRDIFKEEIGIVDGHDGSSYFWIKPVRVIDYSDTNDSNNVAEMSNIEISIEEDDVAQYLTPFLYKYYDDKLEAHKLRVEGQWTDDNGNERVSVVRGFQWYLTYNFFTYESVANILNDINDTVDTLLSGRKNEYIEKLRLKENNVEVALIIDFYRRFIYRMKYMMKVGKENGYNLISFMGP